MRQILPFFVLAFIVFNAQSQDTWWGWNGPSIYNTNSGGVGIGTASPIGMLHVLAPSNGHVYLRLETQSSTYQSGLDFANAGGTKFYIFNDNAGSLKIRGTNSGSETDAVPRMQFPLATTDIYMVQSGGNVGVGLSSPGQKLDVNGSVRAVSFISISDERFKTNIRKLENPLGKLSELQGVKYQFNKQQFKDRVFPDGDKNGLIAQQVQKVFPELVTADREGYLAVDYVSMIPILIESIKELKTRLDVLKAEKIQNDLTIDQKKTNEKFKGAYLNQNAPNPSTNSSSIEFLVPDNVFSASIVIHDLSGRQIKKYPITEKGFGKIEIQNLEIGTGIFVYTLLLDGSILDSKKMIITEN